MKGEATGQLDAFAIAAERRERTAAHLADAEHDNIRRDMRDILARLVPGARLETEDLDVAGAAAGTTVTGMFEQRDGEAIIHVALKGNPRETLRHEAVHALKNLGLFTDPEWSVLNETAKSKKWIEKHRIADRYPGMMQDGQPTEAAVEEAIADEFAAWVLEGQEGRREGRGRAPCL